jgi:hypothetical protein
MGKQWKMLLCCHIHDGQQHFRPQTCAANLLVQSLPMAAIHIVDASFDKLIKE